MLRDFSDEAKQKLLQYVKDVTSTTTWDTITDFFGDIGLTVQGWFGKLDIQNYVNDVDAYHKKILDKNDTTTQQIETIFTDVQAVDTKYISVVSQQISCGNNIIKLINDLADTINPNGGNMDMSRMKGVLEADVEDIRNSKATVEKTIEEKMLGTDAEGCMNSEDPVNLSTGNFIYEHEDLKIGGEIPLSFHRYYNSKDSRRGVLGNCFLHNYQISLEKEKNGTVGVRLADGQINYYDKNEQGEYVGRNTALEFLKETEEGYILIHPGQERISFDREGKMLRKENMNGRGISFSYLEDGKLEKAEADNGSSLTYNYNKEEQLEKVTDHTGRTVLLQYQGKELKKVITASGAEYAYRYGENGRITEVENARQVTSVKNLYDRRFRIIHQEFPDGGTMTFAYDDKNRRVTLTERNGSKIIHVHDDRYRNIETIYEDGTKEKYLYNDKNQCISKTDRLGRTTRMAYDNRGNLTQTVDAMKRRVNYTYDADCHLLSVSINGKERLKNHYDAKGNLTGTENLYGNRVAVKNDEAGRPQAVTYADGSFLEISYDERGNIVKLKDVSGSATTYGYDALNRVTETVDANSNVTRYAYDAANRITAVTDALGNQRAYTYNPGGKIMAIRDFDGNEAGFTYNPLGKVETYTDKEGQTVHFTYDKMWNISSVTAPDQGRQEYIYDSNNRLVKQTLPMGGVVTYAYDAAGNRTEMTDPAGNTTRYCYDDVNRLTEVLEADGARTAYEYDREGNLIKETNAAGQVTSYTYDDLGRRTSVTNPAGATTSVFYNELGKAERICYPNGSSTVYEYEKGGRLKSVRYPDGAGEHYGYDAKGNLTERTTTAGESYCYNYDSLDRMISVQNPAGGISYFTYDALGRVIKAENENGNQTCYEYTPNGNLAKVTDAMGNETFYQYDAMGHLTQSSCTGAEGEEPQNTVYTWDKEGHVTAVTDPLGDVECYTYDPAGRMKAKIDKDGYETSFHYGKDGQVEEIRYADGRTVSLTYNAIRQLEEVRDWLGTTKIAMDEAGHIASVTDPYGKTVGYEWGSMGERTAICYPDGRRAAYEYNEAMQLSALKLLSDDAQEKTILYSYDEAGRLTGKQFPGGNRTDYSYNGAGKIKEILHTGADFTERYHYDYDVMGNKVLAEKERPGLPEDSGNFSYDYDALNRLTSVACNGKTLRTYGYDAFGNRNTRTEYQTAGELVTTYHYNTKNQLTQETNASGTKNYNYDHRGNLLSVTSGEEVLKAYGFDAANRMSSSVDRTAGEITKAYYQYNGLGHRVGQTIASGNADVTQTIRYTLDLTRQYHNLLQKTGNGLDQIYFWDGNVTGMEENGRDHFYFQDDLGSPMRLTDEDGRSEEVYGFDEFGNDIRTAKDIFKDSLQSFGFTGYQMDSVGALYFAQARRYDAGVGRFISEDFIKGHIAAPYTMNHYNYCWNRPLDLVDLNGMWPSLSDIKDGIVGTVKKAGKWISDHKDTIATVATVVVSAAVVVGCVAAAPVAGAVLAGAAIGGAIGGVSEVASQVAADGKVTSVKKVIISTALGAASGALTGGTASAGTAMVANGALSAGGSVAKDIVSLSEGEDISGGQIVANATINGIIGFVSGAMGGAGAQHNKYYVNEVKSIMFDGKNVLEASVRKVWSESGKYYTDSITKAMVKGFCSGSVPSVGSTIWQIVTDKREKNECAYS